MRTAKAKDKEQRTQTFIRNVRFLTKGHTGEFELACGVCRGYLARAEQSNVANMSMAIAIRMAAKLGYTVEQLSEDGVIRDRQIADIDAKIAELNDQREALAK